MARNRRDPRTKEEILNRMLSYDFNGDIRDLGAMPASITRTGPHTLRLTFPDSGTVFDLSVHRPREFARPNPKAAKRLAETRRSPDEDREIPNGDERRAARQETDQDEREQANAPQKRARRQRVDRTIPPSQRRAQG